MNRRLVHLVGQLLQVRIVGRWRVITVGGHSNDGGRSGWCPRWGGRFIGEEHGRVQLDGIIVAGRHDCGDCVIIGRLLASHLIGHIDNIHGTAVGLRTISKFNKALRIQWKFSKIFYLHHLVGKHPFSGACATSSTWPYKSAGSQIQDRTEEESIWDLQ